jgi:hypothetical protein
LEGVNKSISSFHLHNTSRLYIYFKSTDKRRNMHSLMPYNSNTTNININMGGYPGQNPMMGGHPGHMPMLGGGHGLNGNSGAEMMQLMQMMMTLTAAMLAMMTGQQGGVMQGGMPNFGGGGGVGTPGLGNFLGSGGGGQRGGGHGGGAGGARGGSGSGGGGGAHGSREAHGHGGGDHGKAGSPSGNLVDVGGKKVDSSIAGNVKAMIAAAKKDGVDLKITSAHRSHEEQKVLYAKYKAGTGNLAAKPGTSHHESGQAIDFTNTPGAYDWLKKNAGRFGLKNLPGEPWHYSPTGR